jgi:hypothetical protein
MEGLVVQKQDNTSRQEKNENEKDEGRAKLHTARYKLQLINPRTPLGTREFVSCIALTVNIEWPRQ